MQDHNRSGAKGPNFKNQTRNRLAQAVSLAVLTAVSVSAVGQTELPTATVGANDDESYRVDRAQSFKYSQPLVETPKTLTVISSTEMRDRGVDNLQDALRGVPGISMAAGEGGVPTGDNMTIRGFSARTDIFADGIRDIAGYSRDTYNTEAIEVAKGPGSSASGRGSVGGSINLVSKSARNENFVDVAGDAGSENDYRFTLDTNQRIGETSAVRLNLLSTDGGVAGRDHVENGMDAVALNFATGLDTASRFGFTAEYQDQDNLPDYGLPWVSNFSDRTDRAFAAPLDQDEGGAPSGVSFDNFYGNVNRDFEKIKATTFTADYEYDLTADSTLRLVARQAKVERNSIITSPRFTFETVDGVRVYGPDDIRWDDEKFRDQENEMTALQAAYISSFDMAGIGHELSVGLEYYDEKETRWSADSNDEDNLNEGVNNLYNPQPTLPFTGNYFRSSAAPSTGTGTTKALYVFDTLTLNESWEINAGLRYENYESETVASSGSSISRDDNMFSWNLAAVYKLQENGTVYFGIGKSFNPAAEDLTASTRGNEIDLEPEESTGYELGTKWELFDNRVLASAALFYTDKSNARTDDPFDGGTEAEVGDNTGAETLDGAQVVKGLELSAFGQITDQLSIAAGYTFQDSEVTKANGADSILVGSELARTPRNSMSLWLSYDLSEDLSFGFGSEYMSKRYNSTNPGGRESAPSYSIFDAMVAWQATDNLQLQFNGDNLGDERYIDLLGGGHFVPGTGRYYRLSARYSF